MPEASLYWTARSAGPRRLCVALCRLFSRRLRASRAAAGRRLWPTFGRSSIRVALGLSLIHI
eukprot:5976481-Alexandrium_andersonii.AAC.1